MKSKKNDMLDLQLFAQASDQLQNTTATLTAEMKTYYEKRLLDQAEPALVHNQFGDPYPIPANGGKTIELRRYDSLPKATTPLTEGVTPNGQTLKVSTVTAELHQYGGWVPITDVLKTTALDNNVLQATKILASQAGRTLDSVTRDVLVGGTNVLYASKTVDGVETAVNSRKNLDKTAKTARRKCCLRASAQLKAMNADPIGDSYVAIVHPYVAYDLMKDPGLDRLAQVRRPPRPCTRVRSARPGNIRFVETSEAKIWRDETCPTGLAVFGTLVMGAHAYGRTELEGGGLEHIVKQLGYGDDPLATSVPPWAGEATQTAERLVEQYLVRV